MSRTLPKATDGHPHQPYEWPELQPAQRALARLERAIRAGRTSTTLSPLYLHGPPGCGKSHLIAGLLDRLGEGVSAVVLAGRDVARSLIEPEERDLLEGADLLVLEEMAAVPVMVSESLAVLLDGRRRRRKPTVAIATVGPALLTKHGARLRSRLAAGLVLAVPALESESRRRFLAQQAEQTGLRLTPEALGWLTEQVPGSFRQLQAVVSRLSQAGGPGGPGGPEFSLAWVQTVLQEQAREATTLEQIVREVGRLYRVKLPQLRGKSRERASLVPRQVSMYLARLLTGMSLEAIGAFFGGRDHTTVLNACRKVEQSLEADPALAGAVKTLRGSLG